MQAPAPSELDEKTFLLRCGHAGHDVSGLVELSPKSPGSDLSPASSLSALLPFSDDLSPTTRSSWHLSHRGAATWMGQKSHDTKRGIATTHTMRITGAPSLLAALLCATSAIAAATADSIRTADVFVWPISAQSPLPFAKVSYSWPALNATVDSYTAPAVTADETVRVGVHRAGDWVGVAAPTSSFDATKKPALRLYLDADGHVWHVGFSLAAGKPIDGSLAVEVVPVRQGPQVAFDKPIVVNKQGEVDQKEPEKSFLQK